jgi:hypothetical protein
MRRYLAMVVEAPVKVGVPTEERPHFQESTQQPGKALPPHSGDLYPRRSFVTPLFETTFTLT